LLFLCYKEVAYGLGYLLWMSSIAVLFVGDLLAYNAKGWFFFGAMGKKIATFTMCATVLLPVI
jgi:hypothetical protein